jgi:hypothetical protein
LCASGALVNVYGYVDQTDRKKFFSRGWKKNDCSGKQFLEHTIFERTGMHRLSFSKTLAMGIQMSFLRFGAAGYRPGLCRGVPVLPQTNLYNSPHPDAWQQEKPGCLDESFLEILF